MTRTLPLLLLLPLGGCDLFNSGTDIVNGLLNPLVAEGMLLATVPPGSGDSAGESFSLADAGLDEGTSLTLFLADAASVTEIENAPVTDATVFIHGEEASGGEGGLYTYAGSGLTYEEGATWNLDVDVADTSARAALHLPQEPTFTAPTLTANTAVTVDLTGQGFNSALVVVLEATSGLTYSNQPTGIREFYDFTHGGDDVTTVEIPAEAFPGDGVYAIGIAGLVHTVGDDLTEMNTGLTSIMSGKMVFETATIGIGQ
ncbi:MAG: hypothetical protein EP330_18210 [Deltaproteobacteria bacterium]|nr:MAG: hypothetical protein EP330_18210 [Deltaproteobacteria bacterium]